MQTRSQLFPAIQIEGIKLASEIAKTRSMMGQRPQVTQKQPEMSRRQGLIEWLIETERQIPKDGSYETEQSLRQAVAGGFARIGDFKRGRDLAEDWGVRTKIEVALQIMVHEIEKNLKSQVPALDLLDLYQVYDQKLY